jgi:Leucine Rich repeat
MRFSLRAFFLVVLLVSTVLGIFITRVNRQRSAIAAILRLGGTVDCESLLGERLEPYLAPQWLKANLGSDYFRTVVSVNLMKSSVQDDDLQLLSGFANLNGLYLADCPNLTDRGMKHLVGLHSLQILYLMGTQVSDAGIESLVRLKSLESFRAGSRGISDASIERLRNLTKLKSLLLSDASITNDGVAILKQMPQLETISLSNSPNITDAGLIHLVELTLPTKAARCSLSSER